VSRPSTLPCLPPENPSMDPRVPYCRDHDHGWDASSASACFRWR
jgi:hypothetical protein